MHLNIVRFNGIIYLMETFRVGFYLSGWLVGWMVSLFWCGIKGEGEGEGEEGKGKRREKTKQGPNYLH